MISIIHLIEKDSQYEPFMTGVAKQIGGAGYPTGQYRVGMAPPSVELAKQKAAEQQQKNLQLQQLRDVRRKKNPTPQERLQGAY